MIDLTCPHILHHSIVYFAAFLAIGGRSPALFPTIDGFIRREEQENKNLHADGCDFVHLGSRHTDDPDTRRPSTPDNRIFRLLPKYSDKEPEPRGPDTHEREGERESSLARLLYELIHIRKFWGDHHNRETCH